MNATQKHTRIFKSPDYLTSIKNNQAVSMQFDIFSHDAEAAFIKIIHRLVEKHDILYLKEMLVTVIREIITNAVKANAKRLYFKMINLDILKTEDYRTGMETFKKDVYASEADYLDKLKNENLFVKIIFKNFNDSIQISVVNNSPILEVERKKIEWRIKKAYSYNELSDAFDDVMDDSEGTGLGLILALMLCKNAGFPREVFRIRCKDSITIATISIPLNADNSRHDSRIANKVLKELDKLPSFPENIREIQRICSDSHSTFKQISDSIKNNPELESLLLKVANSLGIASFNQTGNLEDAVKLLGIKTINSMLVASGVKQIFNSRYKKREDIWQKSYKAAYYAQKMAIQTKQTKYFDLVYQSALLADIGKMILLSVEQNSMNKMKEVANSRITANTSLLEEISLGISHATLGALICEKWKFSEPLINLIKYHNRPHVVPEKYKSLAYLIYLAYSLIAIENKKLRFEILDEDVLNFYNINNKEKFELLHRTLKKSYQTQYITV
ncbi:MAG: HDOD domain-containing protein [Spirochaetes bacterium]|nr:HDOD domain-containing protein [Spirochaetota bacterium]